MTLGQWFTATYVVCAVLTWVAILPSVDRWGNGSAGIQRTRGDHIGTGIISLILAAVWPITLTLWVVFAALARLVPVIIRWRNS